MNDKIEFYYFTASYPYGIGESWKKNELDIFKKYFKKITIIPYSYDGNKDNPKNIPSEIALEKPIFSKKFYLKKFSILDLLSKNIFYYLKEFFNKKVFLKKSHFISWYIASVKIEKILQNQTIKKIIDNKDKKILLYFFWGRGACDFVPFIKKKYKNLTFIRMHRYDLYENINDNYIPYRNLLFKNNNFIAPCSENGKKYLQKKYPDFNQKIILSRLGTISKGRARQSKDGILRIISCSYLVDKKRVDIIAKAISKLTFKVHWTHLGGGPLFDKIQSIVSTFPDNVNCNLTGMINSDKIMDYYVNKQVDLFINMSESEGVPISIMEAMSAGIPIFATNVGGTSEIVNNLIGKILNENINSLELANEIILFHKESKLKKRAMRDKSFEMYLNKSNATNLSNETAKFLLEKFEKLK